MWLCNTQIVGFFFFFFFEHFYVRLADCNCGDGFKGKKNKKIQEFCLLLLFLISKISFFAV